MDKEQKHRLIDEIKRMEKELLLKKSQLAASETRKYEGKLSDSITKYSDPKECKKIFSELIKRIGKASSGGSSVEDIRKERDR